MMKTKLFMLLAFFAFTLGVQAKKYPEIKFEKTTVDLGTFSYEEPVRKCVFKFTNVGKAKLVINSVRVSCGCTVANYPKDFIAPGASGEISVVYDGSNKMPGRFKQYITIISNCKDELARIFVVGDMTDVPVSKKTETKKTGTEAK